MKQIVFIDTEVRIDDKKALDYGAIDSIRNRIHTGNVVEFEKFIEKREYICGHNIINHDSKYTNLPKDSQLIDTLYISPLLFPNKPYHALLKDDKILSNELNNPLNDAIKAMELFYDEIDAFETLNLKLKNVYYMLLKDNPYFSGFWDYIGFSADVDLKNTILEYFHGMLCENTPLSSLINETPTELAYCLALLSATEKHSLIPRWVQINFPKVDNVIHQLRNTSCNCCDYCREVLNPHRYLKKYFGYPDFRKYNDEPLQENAIKSAINNESLLAIFPTGGGKSLTFQIPALISSETERGLTVIISPLQSLMKDQVDNFEKKGLESAVMINGLLSPIERAEAINRIETGIASILYISPESLRSVTIERLFLSRHITRFVIDEAHCFSAWGHDFRVDYMYIGDFIRELQEKKGNNYRIPVSCFTATAKKKVISDIKEYFKNRLDIDLKLFATNASRTNLRYEVLYKESDSEKYDTLRNLIQTKGCPTIVYVSRKARTLEIAEKLCYDGFTALPFHGRMESSEKQANQEAFINDEVQIIVATSAFGMGVDKSNVGLVIHYDISDSLENYIQEAGRAGRDQSLNAECYVLFNNDDLDEHFILLNQNKLSISEIQQVWKAIKTLTKTRPEVCCSPLEIARQAGWDDNVFDIETRIKTAVQALENSGYIKRGQNAPRVYATSIIVKSMEEASTKIDNSLYFETDEERQTAKRIIKSLISSKSISQADNSDAESRVDYIADRLGIEKTSVIHSIQQMRNDGLLADAKDLTAYIKKSDTENKSLIVLKKYRALEMYLLKSLESEKFYLNYKELNDNALSNGIKGASINAIKTLFYYWTICGYIQKEQDDSTNKVMVAIQQKLGILKDRRAKSYAIAEFIVSYLYDINKKDDSTTSETLVAFSVLDIVKAYKSKTNLEVSSTDVEEALLFLSKIHSIKLDGGFFVLYEGMRLKKLIHDNRIKYKLEDYKQLNEFYQQKVQQIHIVGEYANMMVKSYDDALQFVNDYFQMDYKKFLPKYFSGERIEEIQHNITPKKYHQIFDTLSKQQLEIIKDKGSQYIVCTAGPGSGKTRVLVHKLASLLLMEDVKHEQLLMLTFSRNAVIEFKNRLRELIGNATYFVEIKTFHSYCFDLLGKIGSLQESQNVVQDATDLIRSDEIDMGRITKSVLVIDEAQDMDEHEFDLVKALMERNEDMRIIAVGDDDQNIYEFRGSNSKYLKSLITEHNAKQYHLVDNYRSSQSIVNFANTFVKGISNRMKSVDIRAISNNCGVVKLIKHTSKHIEEALVNDVIKSSNDGTTCILTNTNEEALIVLGALKRQGIKSKLIQSIENMDIYNIAEIRFFIKSLNLSASTPIISDEKWNCALKLLNDRYKNSECLPLILDILTAFSDNNQKKYRMDFEIFLHESNLEDFYRQEEGVVTVSTMHKSKGREFNNVFMLLNNPILTCDADKRKLYVAITRAKSKLHIHYTGNVFDAYIPHATEYFLNSTIYNKPSEIIMQFSYKDVHLDFFKDKKDLILKKLSSGYLLEIRGKYLYFRNNKKVYPHPVMKLSSQGYEKVQNAMRSGYHPYLAKIRFIVSWKSPDDGLEYAIILPNIYFRLC